MDVCRQSIVFDELPDLVTCLACIARDTDVRVIRIKNRLSPDYNAAVSAGYRDVGLNLRILSREATALGVETHVCEVQLLLRDFAALKVHSLSTSRSPSASCSARLLPTTAE